MENRQVVFGENAGLADYVVRIETAAAIVSGANMNFASLCFISSDAALVRIKDEVLADGLIDLDEARRLLKILDAAFTPTEPCVRLIGTLCDAVGAGEVLASRSREIVQAIDEALNLRVTTAEARRQLMG